MLASDLFIKLSPCLQRELSLELLSSTILEFPLLKEAPHAFVAELAEAHEWVQALKGDLVVEEGQLLQELVFVVHGQLIIHYEVDGEDTAGNFRSICQGWVE